jgi:hypothetical protein
MCLSVRRHEDHQEEHCDRTTDGEKYAAPRARRTRCVKLPFVSVDPEMFFGRTPVAICDFLHCDLSYLQALKQQARSLLLPRPRILDQCTYTSIDVGYQAGDRSDVLVQRVNDYLPGLLLDPFRRDRARIHNIAPHHVTELDRQNL